tara:strand:+ start:233 stop:469 length:237 start_codon:yes stop_codon:yes gene_type:complete
MTIKDDQIFRIIFCAREYQYEPEKNIDFPIIENEYSWAELKEKKHPLYHLVQQVLKEEREKIHLEAEKQESKFILETN